MITKRREYQIKKLQYELNCSQTCPEKKSKPFKRTRIAIREPNWQKQDNSMSPPYNFLPSPQNSQEERANSSRHRQQQRVQHKSLYDRPFHLLRQYLHRKQKHTFMPLFDTNPQRFDDLSKAYNTMNEFRIKKSKKVLAFNPTNYLRPPEIPHTNKINKVDEDFITFNTSKNLYQMTQKELQESIKWKKQFLNMLNEKIKGSKVNDSTLK